MRGLVSAVIAAALSANASAAVAPLPGDKVGAYQPQDADERGLWMQMDEAERDLKTSQSLVLDPALNAYVKGVLCRAVGAENCGAARIYIVRTAQFNASMAPNGMMQVWTGLLLRMRDEAQLAAVLGHEFGHYAGRHSLALFRDIRKKTDAAAWLSFIPYVGLIASVGVLGSIFQFSREMERAADMKSLEYLHQGGYPKIAAAQIWGQLREEADATAAARNRKSRKDKNGGFFASHPGSAERLAYLTQAAQGDSGGDRGEDRWRAAMRSWWPELVDDQIKLNDFGATELLINELARPGWTPELYYARGELLRARGKDGDFAAAAAAYQSAIAAGTDLPEAYRGLGLALMRSGAATDGRAALKEYLRLRPQAGDRQMMAMMAGG